MSTDETSPARCCITQPERSHQSFRNAGIYQKHFAAIFWADRTRHLDIDALALNVSGDFQSKNGA
jgi:hypothetical protein